MTDTQTPVTVGSLLGRVKWFRNGEGYGYGYITCVSQNVPETDSDVYVWQANIVPTVIERCVLRVIAEFLWV